MKKLLALLGLLFCLTGSAATLTLPDGAAATITNYIAMAATGDVLAIPAGTNIWTNRITCTKALTFLYAGTNTCAIVDNIIFSTDVNAVGNGGLAWTTPNLTNICRISGVSVLPGTRAQVNLCGFFQVSGSCTNFRMDHTYWGQIKNRAVLVSGSVLGVADHNRFDYRGNGQPFLIFADSLFKPNVAFQVGGDGSWENPVSWGSRGFFFIEDNLFTPITSAVVGSLDGWNGDRVCFRHNLVYGLQTHISGHGTESAQRPRGCRAMEIYANTFITTNAFDTCIDLRSGSGLIWGNYVRGTWNSFIKGNAYRQFVQFPPWGSADGTSLWDVPDLSDDPSTPGGAGDGVFENGTITSISGRDTAIDSSKNWGSTNWHGYTFRQFRTYFVSGGGHQGSFSNFVVTGAGWTTNQWAGFEVRNDTTGGRSRIASNTSDTALMTGNYAQIGFTNGQSATFFIAAEILSNTTNKITTYNQGGFGPNGLDYLFTVGLNYEIRRVDRALDGTGAGLTLALPAITNPNNTNLSQVIEPVYEWNNDLASLSGGIFTGSHVSPSASAIHAGRDFFTDTAPPFAYTPYMYPHDLQGAPTDTFPTILPPASQTLLIGTASAALPFIIGDAETDPALLTLTAATDNPVLLPLTGIVFGGSGANRTVTLTPRFSIGTAHPIIFVTDGNGNVTPGSFMLTVYTTPVGVAYATNANVINLRGQ